MQQIVIATFLQLDTVRHTPCLERADMIKTVLATICAAFLATQVARAITIDFDSSTPAGVTQTLVNASVVSGDAPGLYFAPYSGQSNEDTTQYLAVFGNGAATFNFGSVVQHNLSLTVGVLDSYNAITIAGTSGSTTITGQDLINAGHAAGSSFTYSLGNVSFTSVTFSSSSNTFELDNVKTSVPDGGTTAVLLGLAMFSIVAVRSKLAVV